MLVSQLAIALSISAFLMLHMARPLTNIDDQNVIVICVWSEDAPPEASIGEIEETMRKVCDYYDECSYSQVHLQFSVTGWFQLALQMTYYSTQRMVGDVEHSGASDQLILDAIARADSKIDFSMFNRLIVVHSGRGAQESGGNRTLIGSCHKRGWYPTLDGRIFLGVSVMSEFDGMGTYAHELGHDFGAPDLYDYHSDRPSCTGISRWGLMSSGNYNGNPSGSVPAHMCAFTKLQIGWIQSHDIYSIQNDSHRVELSPISSLTAGYRAVRYDLPDGRYYLVEARVQSGYDSALFDSGVLVMLVNESKLAERRDMVQLQVPIYSTWLGDAALRAGETYHDSDNSFAVRVIEVRDDKIVIDVSTSIVEDWSISRRIEVDTENQIRDIYTTTAEMDYFIGGYGNYAFAAVFVYNGTDENINLYLSYNSGRDWEFLASTNETEYSVHAYGFSMCYLKGTFFLVGRIYGPDRSFIGSLNYHFSSSSFTLTNLSAMVGHSLGNAIAVASNNTLYICCYSNPNGTQGIANFRLRDAQWNHTFHSIPNLFQFALSNVPDNHHAPFVLFRNASEYLHLVRFNESAVLHTWTSSEAELYDFEVACSTNRIMVVYHDGFTNESYTSTSLCIQIGNISTGFDEFLQRHYTNPVGLVSLSYKNATDTFHVLEWEDGNLTEFVVQEAWIEHLLTDFYVCSMAKFDLTEHPIRILLGRTSSQSLVSIAWTLGPPEGVRAPVYFVDIPNSALSLPVMSAILVALLIITLLALENHRVLRLIGHVGFRSRFRKVLQDIRLRTFQETELIRLYFITPILLAANILFSVVVSLSILTFPIPGLMITLGTIVVNQWDCLITLHHWMQVLLVLSVFLTLTLTYENTKTWSLVKYAVIIGVPIMLSVVFSLIVFQAWIGLLVGFATISIPIHVFTKRLMNHTRASKVWEKASNSLKLNLIDYGSFAERDAMIEILRILHDHLPHKVVEVTPDQLLTSDEEMILEKIKEQILKEVRNLRKSLDQNARELLDSSIEILDSNTSKEDEISLWSRVLSRLRR